MDGTLGKPHNPPLGSMLPWLSVVCKYCMHLFICCVTALQWYNYYVTVKSLTSKYDYCTVQTLTLPRITLVLRDKYSLVVT